MKSYPFGYLFVRLAKILAIVLFAAGLLAATLRYVQGALDARARQYAQSKALEADLSHLDREYERLIDEGDIRAALVIPPRFHARLIAGERVPVQVIINGDNSNTAATVMGYALRILQGASTEYQVRAATPGAGPPIGPHPSSRPSADTMPGAPCAGTSVTRPITTTDQASPAHAAATTGPCRRRSAAGRGGSASAWPWACDWLCWPP